MTEALAIARDVCAALSPQGRPLYAAHADLPWPEDDLLALWHAATLVREHRGDGHVAVLQTHGLDPVEATVLGGTVVRLDRASSARPAAGPTRSRTPRPTGSGSAAGSTPTACSPTWAAPSGSGIEDDTDRLAVEGWAAVGAERTARLHELVAPLRRTIQASDLLPRSLRP